MGKFVEAPKALLKEMTSNNYHWSSERAISRRSGGKCDVDTVTLLASKVDALAQRLDRVDTSPLQGVLQGHQLESTLSARPVVCRSTHPLSATMVLLPLSTPTSCITSTPHCKAIHTPMLRVCDGRATPTPLTRSLALNLRMSCNHLGSSTELPITHLPNRRNPN